MVERHGPPKVCSEVGCVHVTRRKWRMEKHLQNKHGLSHQVAVAKTIAILTDALRPSPTPIGISNDQYAANRAQSSLPSWPASNSTSTPASSSSLQPSSRTPNPASYQAIDHPILLFPPHTSHIVPSQANFFNADGSVLYTPGGSMSSIESLPLNQDDDRPIFTQYEMVQMGNLLSDAANDR